MKDYKQAFSHLKDEIRKAGLLKRTPIRGSIEMSIILVTLGASLYYTREINILLLGLFFTIIFTRSVFVSHDLLHNQYFKNKALNKKISYIFSSLLLGLSGSWWDFKHNINHHTWTNCSTKDEDIVVLNKTFTNEPGEHFLISRFPHLLFWGALFFMYAAFIARSFKFVILRKKYIELFFMLLHFLFFYGALFTLLEPQMALYTLLTLHLTLSFWLSLGFITNHLGCDVFSEEECNKMSWMELQLRTSRNIKGGWFVHWFFGGLNTQIEHHLYPKAPRFNLLKAAKITENYCLNHNIAYNSVCAINAYKEINSAISASRKH